MDKAEKKVSEFYKNQGWQEEEGYTEDAWRWEDLRASSQEYVSRCRRRVTRHLAGSRYLVDLGSGPIQYDEYLEFSKSFEKRYCIDLSEQALAGAKRQLGDKGVYLCGSFFDLPFEDDFFDAAVSMHVIYHMHADRQEQAVRKLLRITKGSVVIVYSNPDALTSRIKRLFNSTPHKGVDIYFHAHPINWWERFRDEAEVKLYPWRSFEGGGNAAPYTGRAAGNAGVESSLCSGRALSLILSETLSLSYDCLDQAITFTLALSLLRRDSPC